MGPAVKKRERDKVAATAAYLGSDHVHAKHKCNMEEGKKILLYSYSSRPILDNITKVVHYGTVCGSAG